jgi:carbonic anhydrase
MQRPEGRSTRNLGSRHGESGSVVRSCAAIVLFVCGGTAVLGQQPGAGVTADEALAKLMAGNQRYANLKGQHPDESLARRKELRGGQHPFAVIVGCADSRVAPELLFDQGLGDIFVIRVAGNIVDDAILGSIEYAVEHLGTKLIVVLGHENCGAVSAVVEGGAAAGHLIALVMAIQPSVLATAKEPGDKIHNCVVENARRVARQIRQSEPLLKAAVERNGVTVLAADYALDTGKVTLLEGHR